jgi:hypothetical protein
MRSAGTPAQRVLGGADHGVGAADEDLVHARHRQQGLDDLAHLVAVDAALEQVDLLGLAQHVDQREAVAVAVLEVLQGLVEHHRRHAAVAIDQGELGLGLLLERAGGDRQDGRDARTGGKADAVDRALLLDHEAAIRRHHLDGVAGLDGLGRPVGEQAVLDRADADLQLAPGGRRLRGLLME